MRGKRLERTGIRRVPVICIIISLLTVSGLALEDNHNHASLHPGNTYIGDNFSTPPQAGITGSFHVSDNYSGSPSRKQLPDILSEEMAFSQPYASSSILVRFNNRSDTLPMRVHSAIGADIIRDYSDLGLPGLQQVSPPDQLSVEQAVAYYQSQPGVLYAEPDYYRFSTRVPSDPDFWREWGLSNSGQVYRENGTSGKEGSDIKAAPAWETATGGETIVAVLDSGVDYLHPDLADNILTNTTNSTGYDAITGEMEAMDLASHGTHCAGIIGAVGDNGIGITGVNWHTKILPVRFLNSFGTGTVSDEIESILWATGHGARIISCSYGGSMNSRAEYEVMKGADALFICAAGNNANNNDITPYYPSSHDISNIISVTATDSSDSLATFSNYGAQSVDIGAPGVDIYSTKHNVYKPVPIWTDPFDTFNNWTLQGNWTLNTASYVSPKSSASGTVNRSAPDASPGPAVITLKSPMNITGIENPVLSYQWSLVGMNYSFSIEGSDNGISWRQLEYGKGGLMIAPFMKRECKIPADLRGSALFIRFVADGELSLLGLDDISLSDGYGELTESRWGYMNGTSMACPQVSGMAALLSSASPDTSLEGISRVILTSADPIPSLANKTTTGGRANLSAALIRLTGGSPYHLKLMPGWNHVSVPQRLKPGEDTAEVIFGELKNVSGHSMFRFDSGAWKAMLPDDKIIPLLSYWVYTGSEASLPLFVDPDQSWFVSRNLTTGWNGFGIYNENSIPAKEILKPLGDIWSYVIGFNTTSQQYDEPIIRGGTGNQNDSRLLSSYEGYWIFMIHNGTLGKNETVVTGKKIPEISPWPKKIT